MGGGGRCERAAVPASRADCDEVAPLVVEPCLALHLEPLYPDRQDALRGHAGSRVVVRAAHCPEVDPAVVAVQNRRPVIRVEEKLEPEPAGRARCAEQVMASDPGHDPGRTRGARRQGARRTWLG
jgi:hypothetical protein